MLATTARPPNPEWIRPLSIVRDQDGGDVVTDDDMHHAPNCERPGTTTTHGHSVDVVKCDGCGCLSTVRHHVTVNERTDTQQKVEVAKSRGNKKRVDQQASPDTTPLPAHPGRQVLR